MSDAIETVRQTCPCGCKPPIAMVVVTDLPAIISHVEFACPSCGCVMRKDMDGRSKLVEKRSSS